MFVGHLYLFIYEPSVHILCTLSVVVTFFLLIYDSHVYIIDTIQVLF